MERKTTTNDFNEYYVIQNRIKYLEDLSHNLPISKISGLNKDKITIGNTNIKISENILDVVSDNNVKIDAFTNNDAQVYYVNKRYKKYYQIGGNISVSDFRLEENEILKFNFKYEEQTELNLQFIIIEFSENKGIKSRKYTSLDNISLVPHEDTAFLKVFFIPEKDGFIFNVELNLIKEYMTIFNNHVLKVNTDIMYNPDSRVDMENEKDSLVLKVPELNKKFIYFSYAIENNSFNKIPSTSLIEINPKNLYQLSTPYLLYDEIDFTPTIIEYNKTGKTNLLKLSNKNQFIRFQKDTTAIRLSYRFSGTGKVKIKPVTVKEFESESEFDNVQWDSRYEIDTHMNTVENGKDLRIAVIMDEFTYHSYKYEANLLRLSFDNWKNEIISFMPHFVFIESSWHGNEEAWTKKIAFVTEEKHSYIRQMIDFAKSLKIPVVFWNKEDPVHYDHFIETAKLCDYIFTTDRDRVEDYKLACNHENVDVLQFAAQPVTHNPTKIQSERVDGISFAGSYYALREERSNDMNRLFKASIPYNLYIYDRNYEYTKKGERLNFLFPEEFRKYILGTLPFYQIEKAYKGYKYMININTVKTSPTMYARRVYEGLASGTPIISNYSLGMENQFGDIIGSSEDENKLMDYLNNLNENISEYNKVKQLGIRRTMSEHTYTQRLIQVANKLGYQIHQMKPKVTFISFINERDGLENVVSIYNKINFTNKSLIVIVDGDISDYTFYNSRVSVVSALNLTESFMTLDKFIDADYIAPISINDFYGENYLEDLLLASLYTNADIIGKKNYYINESNSLIEENRNAEHEYTNYVNNEASIIKASVFSNLSIHESLIYLKNEQSLSELKYLGLNIYSNDKMNYIKNGSELTKQLKEKVIV